MSREFDLVENFENFRGTFTDNPAAVSAASFALERLGVGVDAGGRGLQFKTFDNNVATVECDPKVVGALVIPQNLQRVIFPALAEGLMRPITDQTDVQDGYRTGFEESDARVTLFKSLIELRSRFAPMTNAYGDMKASLFDGIRTRRYMARLDEQDKRNEADIASHYDVSSALYYDPVFGFLGKEWEMYSCGVLPDDPGADYSLDDLNRNQIDRLFDLAELEPGAKIGEFGTGAGGLAHRFYERLDGDIRMTTTTLSKDQEARAKERLTEAGISSQAVNVIDRNYRKLEGHEGYEGLDALVASEVIEAIDWRERDYFLESAARMVRPGGMVVLQSINNAKADYNRAKDQNGILNTVVFRNGGLHSHAAERASAEKAGLELVSKTDITPGYIPTLTEWRSRLLAGKDLGTAHLLSQDYLDEDVKTLYGVKSMYLEVSTAVMLPGSAGYDENGEPTSLIVDNQTAYRKAA